MVSLARLPEPEAGELPLESVPTLLDSASITSPLLVMHDVISDFEANDLDANGM